MVGGVERQQVLGERRDRRKNENIEKRKKTGGERCVRERNRGLSLCGGSCVLMAFVHMHGCLWRCTYIQYIYILYFSICIF